MVGLVHTLEAAAHLHEKHDEVYDDQEPRDVRWRRPLERAVIPQRHDHRSPLAGQRFAAIKDVADCPMPSASKRSPLDNRPLG